MQVPGLCSQLSVSGDWAQGPATCSINSPGDSLVESSKILLQQNLSGPDLGTAWQRTEDSAFHLLRDTWNTTQESLYWWAYGSTRSPESRVLGYNPSFSLQASVQRKLRLSSSSPQESVIYLSTWWLGSSITVVLELECAWESPRGLLKTPEPCFPRDFYSICLPS